MAVASLCKGLLATVIPLLVLIPELMNNQRWKQHLRPTLFLALIPALFIYFLPFWASAHFGGQHYGENGLVEVFRENILRFTQPFDHKGPIYTYFVYLPIYLLPWTFFFILAIFTVKKDWPTMTSGERWIAWAILLVFIFYTASGSRRNYYTLPMVPFAILFTANWLARHIDKQVWLRSATKYFAVIFYILSFCLFGIIKPFHYSSGGIRTFASQLYAQATTQRSWSKWTIALLNPEDQAPYYVNGAKQINYPLPSRQAFYLPTQLLQYWPVIKSPPPNTIFLTSKRYVPEIAPYLTQYTMVFTPDYPDAKWWHRNTGEDAVAFIPKNKI
jgi:4-amino-4-deoxy-L-arabinose transferase-like glycosyltransferase